MKNYSPKLKKLLRIAKNRSKPYPRKRLLLCVKCDKFKPKIGKFQKVCFDCCRPPGKTRLLRIQRERKEIDDAI